MLVACQNEDNTFRSALSVATRLAEERGKVLSLDGGNVREIAAGFLAVPPSAKLRHFLELFRRRSTRFGAGVDYDSATDWPLIHALGIEEGKAIHGEACRRKLIEPIGPNGAGPMRLSLDGWNAVEPIGAGVPGLGFVAMFFDKSLDAAYHDGMSAAAQDCGLQLMRADSGHHTEKICDRIIADIRRAQFVIVDFTRQRGNVYFEAGFALALDKTVIWTCREDDSNNVQFDVRQYPLIVWKGPDDLREQLRDRFNALVLKTSDKG